MAVLDHTEASFERLIASELIAGGWSGEDPVEGVAPKDCRLYDATLGLYPPDVVGFIKETQPKKFERLVSLAGSEEKADQSLLKRLADQLDKRGTVEVLRKGFTERGVALTLCFFRPELKADPAAEQRYAANRLRVVRQIRFDPKHGDSVDLVLFVNGIPTATAELKNRYTSQTVDDAVKQYREDREPKNLLFARRAFVHFALDAELAFMTTRLAGPKTKFLPFNQGSNGPGEDGGKGNPSPTDGSHPTSYLWRTVWQRDHWLDLIERFVFVEQPEESKARGAQPTIIFPRYHQWDVVQVCSAHARDKGAGQNYLIQHSAGSGKSKEIAWLAHDLSTIHDAQQKKVFDKVVVITDRRVLDQQLQAQITAFEQVRGTVQKIDQDSAQLREALTGEQAQIVITTLQKFPFVLRQLTDESADLKERTYAVIVDEAHSSQSGDSATDVQAVLGSRSAEDLGLDLDEEDGVPAALLARMAARGKQQPNLSFFAFTATPKGRTLELFGHKPEGSETFQPFHTYSMRQAIEEGFILDVLRNYTTYDQLFRLESKVEEELEVPEGQAQKRLAAYAKFHPYAKDQKAAVIVNHYRRVVRPKLGGKAKAMVVTASREEAVRYKQAIDRYVEREGFDDVKTLVAFSGEVTIRDSKAADYGEGYTEPQMNRVDGHSVPESKLPEEFDKPDYGLLVVAEKYQVGFDQPKLCAMYVDKKLSGVNAVQTLSRLNRVYPGKTETYVLDFANDGEEVRKSFEPFYGQTEATPTDPNVLFDAAQKVMDFGLIDAEDLDRFADEYTKADADHSILSGATQAAYDRALALEEDEREDFRDALDRFVRLHTFLAQIVSYLPVETEKLYLFARFFALRLREGTSGGGMNLNVELTHYRLEELGTENLQLGGDDVEPLSAIHGDGTGGHAGEVPMGLLAQLVELFNERFGQSLSDADAVRPIQQIIDKVAEHEELRDQAVANEFDDFQRGKDALVIDATLDVKDVNDLVLQKLLDDDDLRSRATFLVMKSLYDRYNAEATA